MPRTCESIYRKEFRKFGHHLPAKEYLQAWCPRRLRMKVLLVAVQTTFLQERAIILCEERVDTDP
jgi:hypothetical protein